MARFHLLGPSRHDALAYTASAYLASRAALGLWLLLLACQPALAQTVIRLAPGADPTPLRAFGTLRPLCAPADTALASSLGLDRTYTLAAPAELAPFLIGVPGVEHAEADGLGTVADAPNDPLFPQQWHLRNTGANGLPGGIAGADINYLAARERLAGRTLAPVTLAIIDTGIDLTHPDLAPAVIPGWNVLTGTPDLNESACRHGSHTAGIAGAVTDNALGVAGVATVLLMPVKVLEGCSGSESACAAGIVWAADHGARVCSMSLQYFTGTQALQAAVLYARGRGVLPVAAAGNNAAGGFVAWPAAFPGCVAISATTNQDTLASFSNWGPAVALCAPGEEVLSTFFGGYYVTRSGTSMATPMVAAAACMVWAAFPDLTAEQVEAALEAGAHDLGTPGRDQQFGYGRLDLAGALDAACLANCDGAAGLNVADFACFLTEFAGGDPRANCDGSTVAPTLNVADFTCFLGRFARGCP